MTEAPAIIFYLTTHEPHWLRLAGVPLFVSAPRLMKRRPGVAVDRWVLDSGGYSQLTKHGAYTFTVAEYAENIDRWVEQAQREPDWVAPMDYMCEAEALKQTGLTIRDHQQRTIENYFRLNDRTSVPVAPILQGWEPEHYLEHVDDWYAAGVALHEEATVGVGSVCRKQEDAAISRVIRTIHTQGLSNLHAFGVRGDALRALAPILQSADSLAWSREARSTYPLPGCPHKSCANCLRYALRWREKLLTRIDQQRLEIA